jgi:tRNA(Ser,Leu) C12 N-acetylase TAN1
VCFFLQGYRGFVSKYRGLFGKTDEHSEVEVGERVKTEQERHYEYWGWYVTLDSVSNKDRTKWDYYLNMNVVAFLNYLSYVKDRNKWQ